MRPFEVGMRIGAFAFVAEISGIFSFIALRCVSCGQNKLFKRTLVDNSCEGLGHSFAELFLRGTTF